MKSPEYPFNGCSHWIWADGGVSEPVHCRNSPYRIAYFRRVFDVLDEADTLTVHVSADSRYILYLNGKVVSRGPAKGDIRHQFYDTVKLDGKLIKGRNVLAAVVISYASSWPHPGAIGAPCSIMTVSNAFVLDGVLKGSAGIRDLHTNEQWKSLSDIAYGHTVSEEDDQAYAGLCEELDGRVYPWGWQNIEYDDSSWVKARKIAAAVRPDNVTDSPLPYRLVPRMIPFLEEKSMCFSDIYSNNNEFNGLLSGKALTVDSSSRVSFILDSGNLSTAFPTLRVNNGLGSVIKLTYAEAWTADGKKCAYHQPDGGHITGCHDSYICGMNDQLYEPMNWRTFRYIKVDINTGDIPLTISGISYRFTGYPFEEKAEFFCSDEECGKIWDISWRTMRLCSHETYEDCPYYEQMQYAGDTQAEILYSGYVSGDWRLGRQAIYHFNWSRGYDGLTASRYPSRVPQFIPSWSLLWCVMTREYWWHTGDIDTVHACMDGLISNLQWFEKHENADGLLEALPYWKVVDWVKEWKNPMGYPPGIEGGVSAIINLQYAYALKSVAELCDITGTAHHYRRKAIHICSILAESCWNEEEGLFFDKPGGPEVSELGQAWAILADAVSDDQAKRICDRIGSDKLSKATLYGRYYLFRALSKAGQYAKAYDLFDWWRMMSRTDLTTWPEEPWLARSFCHAWSCAPLYEYLAEILGIKPAAPGFSQVVIEPKPLGFSWARGGIPTVNGDISVKWNIVDNNFNLEVVVPYGIHGTIILPDYSSVNIMDEKTRTCCKYELVL